MRISEERVLENNERTYDVALSFAGEDRGYVEQVASHLRESGVKVFYDRYEEATLWGKDLYEHFHDIYQNKAKYMVMFASEHYARKVWPNHERQSAQARTLREKREYILPARFDDTESLACEKRSVMLTFGISLLNS
jgi:hypothetical protein